jgi:hypothetical protein
MRRHFRVFAFNLETNVITQFWVIPQKSFFFQNKNQNNNNKSWQRGEGKPGNQAVILEEIQGLIVPHYAKKWRKKMQIQGQIK